MVNDNESAKRWCLMALLPADHPSIANMGIPKPADADKFELCFHNLPHEAAMLMVQALADQGAHAVTVTKSPHGEDDDGDTHAMTRH